MKKLVPVYFILIAVYTASGQGVRDEPEGQYNPGTGQLLPGQLSVNGPDGQVSAEQDHQDYTSIDQLIGDTSMILRGGNRCKTSLGGQCQRNKSNCKKKHNASIKGKPYCKGKKKICCYKAATTTTTTTTSTTTRATTTITPLVTTPSSTAATTTTTTATTITTTTTTTTTTTSTTTTITTPTTTTTRAPTTPTTLEYYKAYQTGKYWPSSQCPSISNNAAATLEVCKRRCTNTTNCTAINYHAAGKYCYEKTCPIPAPQPSVSHSGWIGYALPILEYYKPYQTGKVWPSSQCPTISTYYAASLEICKRLCTNTATCTAIHYNSDRKHCELKICPILAPQPSGSSSGWTGYALPILEYYNAYQNGMIWPSSQCPTISTGNTTASLEICKRLCTNTATCTAIHYHASGEHCELKTCLIPALQPSASSSGWRGYALPILEYYKSYQYGKIWPSSQCPTISTGNTTASFENCKRLCTSTANCTAIHYHSSGKHCELKICPIPAPQPSGSSSGWRGYALPILEYYKAYQTGKVWPSSQCQTNSTGNTVASLEVCKRLCTNTATCTAIQYHASRNHCDLKICPIPAPQPSGSSSGWIGYALPILESYRAYQTGKYWTGSQCPWFSGGRAAATLKVCKRRCTNTVNCTAIVYHATSSYCYMLTCPIPAAQPSYSISGYIGYALPILEYYRAYQSGKFWPSSQCLTIPTGSIVATLDFCKRLCTNTAMCTAINYNAIHYTCELKDCRTPAPQPSGSSSGWTGYANT